MMIIHIKYFNFILFTIISLNPIHNCLKIANAPDTVRKMVYYKDNLYLLALKIIHKTDLNFQNISVFQKCDEDFKLNSLNHVGFLEDEAIVICGKQHCFAIKDSKCQRSNDKSVQPTTELINGESFVLLVNPSKQGIEQDHFRLWSPKHYSMNLKNKGDYVIDIHGSVYYKDIYIGGAETIVNPKGPKRYFLIKFSIPNHAKHLLHMFDQRFLISKGSEECRYIKSLIKGEIMIYDNYSIPMFIDDQGNVCLVYWPNETKDCSHNEFYAKYNLKKESIQNSGECQPSVTKNETLSTFKIKAIVDSSITNGWYKCIKKNSSQLCMLFYGLSSGELKKARLVLDKEHSVMKRSYVIKKFDNETAIFHSQDEYIYGLVPISETKTKMFKAEFYYCYRSNHTCSKCIVAGDPNCVWCPFNSKCVRHPNDCEAAMHVEEYENCPSMKTPDPQYILAGTRVKMTITIQHLPSYPSSGDTICKWHHGPGVSSTSDATVNDLTVTCLTPNIESSEEKERWTMDVEILYRQNKKESYMRPLESNGTITVYSCKYYKSCKPCQDLNGFINGTDFPFKCNWDVNKAFCDVPDEANPTSKCPMLIPSNHSRIPKTIVHDVPILAENLPDPMYRGFKCKIGEKTFPFVTVNATLGKCKGVELTSVPTSTFITAVAVNITDGKRHIDVVDEENLEIYVYDCTKLKDCLEDCIQRQYEDYSCQWSNGTCRDAIGRRKQRSPTCYPPNVTHIIPVDGPLKGGTLVSIYGDYLDYYEDELRNKLILAGVICKVKDITRYRLQCHTGETSSERTGYVQITKYTLKSFNFTYKRLTLMSVIPDYCLTNFPSKVMIYVLNFDVGFKRSLIYSPMIKCDGGSGANFIGEYVKLNDSYYEVECPKCPKHTKASKHTVSAKVDDDESSFRPFYITPIPKITKMIDKDSIDSGGIRIRFRSKNPSRFFGRLEMRVFDNDEILRTTDCTFDGDISYCETPPVGDLRAETNRYRIGFIAEPRERQFYTLKESFDLTYVPDPVFKMITEDDKTDDADTFVVEAEEGTTLLKGARSFDYVLNIGRFRFLNPTIEKDEVKFDISSLPEFYMDKAMSVRIQVGKFFEQRLGYRTIHRSNPALIFLPILLYLLLCILILLFALYFAKRSRRSERDETESVPKPKKMSSIRKASMRFFHEPPEMKACYIKQYLKSGAKEERNDTIDSETISLYSDGRS